MKRKLLMAGAAVMATFLAGAMVAEAASVKFGGVLRPRFEIWEQRSFDSNSDASYFVNARMRLNADVEIDSNTSAFFQLQANQRWGAGAVSADASDHNPLSPNSNTSDVGFHQVYFTLKNFMNLPVAVDMRVGRQEIILDGHRLFGNTIWTQGGQSHDAVRFDHQHGENTHVTGFWSKARENGSQGPSAALNGGDAQDDSDINVYTLWLNHKHNMLGKGALSLYYVAYQDGTPANESLWHTIGFRQAANMGGIDYRVEFYYQLGDAGNIAATNLGGSAGGSVGAYLLGVRAGKTFDSVMWTPTVTLWYDRLSGSTDSDISKGDWGTFNTLFDTGHKYYGLIDVYLNPAGSNTGYAGLIDYAIKTSVKPMAKTTLKADWHLFQTETQFKNNPLMAASQGVASQGQTLGHELDLTLVYAYSSNVTVSGGYSHYWATQLFHEASGFALTGFDGDGTDQGADWAYVQFDVKF